MKLEPGTVWECVRAIDLGEYETILVKKKPVRVVTWHLGREPDYTRDDVTHVHVQFLACTSIGGGWQKSYKANKPVLRLREETTNEPDTAAV